jgi:hypothetical protein
MLIIGAVSVQAANLRQAGQSASMMETDRVLPRSRSGTLVPVGATNTTLPVLHVPSSMNQ